MRQVKHTTMLDDARQLLQRRLSEARMTGGCIDVWISSDPLRGHDLYSCRSNFFCALTLSALQAAAFPEDGLASLRDELARSLQSELSPHGTVNYWMRNEPLRKTRPYPNDLDTTSSTLAALTMADPSRAGILLGGAVRALTAVETQEGGPYRTWLVTSDAPEAWRDVDVAVNANIAFYLSQNGIRLDALDAWLADQIERSAYASPYYPSSFPIWYFLARGYRGRASAKLQSDILQARHTDGSWGNILDDALATSALSYLDADIALLLDAKTHLAKRITREPSDAFIGPFCIDSVTSGMPSYAGSRALTLAICLEAMNVTSPDEVDVKKGSKEGAEDLPFPRIIESLRVRAARLGEPLTSQLLAATDKIVSGTPGPEIPLLPHFFNVCLHQSIVSEEQISVLGEANVLGWIAYTIYDDILDGEGDIRELSLANACLREVDMIFSKLAQKTPSIRALYQDVMDTLERANAWEAQYARIENRDGVVTLPPILPSYGDLAMLADRSFGHALGPLCILLLNGHTRTSDDVRYLTTFFRHALIARQLDDDAHDWADDLSAGRINAVAERVLRTWRARGHDEITIDRNGFEALRSFFWEECMDDIAGMILEHVMSAEGALVSLRVLKTIEPLSHLLDSARVSAQKARRGVREAKTFIAAYRGEIADKRI